MKPRTFLRNIWLYINKNPIPPEFAYMSSKPLTPGKVIKGGVNLRPTTPRPIKPPSAQKPAVCNSCILK